MSALPSPFIEFSNGILYVLLIWMIIFNAKYLLYRLKNFYNGSIFALYAQSKASIALGVFLIGFFLKVFPIWFIRMFEGQNQFGKFIYVAAPLTVGVGTVLAVIGGACWIRVIVPMKYPRCAWTLIMLSSVIYSAAFSLCFSHLF